MLIDFNSMFASVLPSQHGDSFEAKTFLYKDGRIMNITLQPGDIIGEHGHGGAYEILYAVEGVCTVVCDGERERLASGNCHLLPPGKKHTIINIGKHETELLSIIANK